MTLFTDRQLGKKAPIINDINVTVWNGIIVIIDSFISDNSFSRDFPEHCPDNLGVCGCNMTLFNDKLKAIVPNLEIPLTRKEKFEESYGLSDFDVKGIPVEINTYDCLDLIEFCYLHLTDAEQKGRLHEYFNHYHLSFKDSGKSKEKFCLEINTLFERNQIAYKLNNDGQIIRLIPNEFNAIIKHRYRTNDDTLNALLKQATDYFILPKLEDRERALEKSWDAFERMKTYYNENKRTSSTQLINIVSSGNELFEEYLIKEAKTLTEIGNKFQIRHFETDKQPIQDNPHIDYLFYRIFALIDLFIKELED